MQTKTIRKAIKAKMLAWLETITDTRLREDVKNSLLVSGGSITSMFLNEPVNDYDVYLQDMDVCLRLAVYYKPQADNVEIFDGRKKDEYIRKYNSDNEHLALHEKQAIDSNNVYAVCLRNLRPAQIKLFIGGAPGLKVNDDVDDDDPRFMPKFYSPNSISLSNKIQIVLRFTGSPEEIHKTFDFIHATNYFTFKEKLVLNLDAIECILTKQLRYQGSKYPVTSIIRAKKFTKRGFNINAGEHMKIMYQISELNLGDVDVLEEQMTGVDVAYLGTVISAMRNKYESTPDFKMTSDYFNELVDHIFNDSDEDDEPVV